MGRRQARAGHCGTAGALGVGGGEREENEAELGVSFGPNPGAIVHFSTSSLTRPPKRIAARAASQRLPRPFGPRQPPVGAKLRNYPEKFGRHTDTNTGLHFNERIRVVENDLPVWIGLQDIGNTGADYGNRDHT